MSVPKNSQQMTLRFETGLAARHLSLRDCLLQRVYEAGHGRISNLLDIAPSKLTEKLAGCDSSGKVRGMTVDQFEAYLAKTGDVTPLYYLIEKYLSDPEAVQREALAKLARFADALPALLSAAGLGAGMNQ